MDEYAARALALKTRADLLALEATLTTDAQRAAAATLHADLGLVAAGLRARWTDLFPGGDPTGFHTDSTGGDKP